MEGQAVFVVDENNTVERRRVVAGPRQGNRWVIEKGLQAGEKVVVEGLQRVRPGIKVNPSPLSQVTETKLASFPPANSPSRKDSQKSSESD